jgi:hypothetical protein
MVGRMQMTMLCAGLGAWLGFLTGLPLGLVAGGSGWLVYPLAGLLIGAAAGGLLGLLIQLTVDRRRYVADTAGQQARRDPDEPSTAPPRELVG